MRTDALFYELFKFDQSSLFRLLNMEITSQYIYESITVKTTEDGLMAFLKARTAPA
jgi:hypothetical protein